MWRTWLPSVVKNLLIPRPARRRGHRLNRPVPPGVEFLEVRNLLSGGGLDPAFGTGGQVITPVSTLATGGAIHSDSARGVVVQPDGKIIAAGWAINGNNQDFALVRYLPDGSTDPRFGTGGKVLTDFFGRDDFITAVALQPDRRIVVLGNIHAADNTFKIALARYNPDGSLDDGSASDSTPGDSFGTAGKVVLEPAPVGRVDSANGLAIQGDGKVLVVSQTRNGLPAGKLVVLRFTASGAPDPTFGQGGMTSYSADTKYAYLGNDVTVQPDGKIVVAGSVGVPTNAGQDPINWNFTAARFNTDGSLDAGFGANGFINTPVGGPYDSGNKVVVQPDGNIVVAGIMGRGAPFYGEDFAVVRYLPNGSLDPAFGTNGMVITDVSPNDSATGLALERDGKILVGGSVGTKGSPTFQFALLRYDAHGTLDPGFGTGGVVETDLRGDGRTDLASALAMQPDGRIVLAGTSFTANDGGDFGLARYLSFDAGAFAFSAPSYSTQEGDTFVLITVNRVGADNDPANVASVDYQVGGAANAGSRQVDSGSGTLSFLGGQDSRTIKVVLHDDGFYQQPAEVVPLTLSNPTNGARLGGTPSASLTILENQLPPNVSVADVTVTVPGGGVRYASFLVSLSGPVSLTPSTVRVRTRSGTASPPVYEPTDVVITFAPKEFAHALDVPVHGGPSSSSVLTFYLDLSAADGAVIDRGTAQATLRFDIPPAIEPNPVTPPAVVSTPTVLVPQILRRGRRVLLQITDPITGQVRRTISLPSRAKWLRRDVNGDGIPDFLILFRLSNGRVQKRAYDGSTGGPLP